ncbi:hypothetical protein Syun_025190 [Stephania yunnanensis]|uniref:Uncharacterized protein n=1 Tax=Stephania yunnanensis TaxID=152371 RepID=A0AAP0HW02_9MAGN
MIQKEFMKYDVPHFYRDPDHIEAETWILNMEKRKYISGIDEKTMVHLVAFLLEHKVDRWWLSISRTRGLNMSRSQLKHLFLHLCHLML